MSCWLYRAFYCEFEATPLTEVGTTNDIKTRERVMFGNGACGDFDRGPCIARWRWMKTNDEGDGWRFRDGGDLRGPGLKV